MPISWEDLEAHRDRLTPLQWERFKAFIHDGKTLVQIGGAGADGLARSSLNQSIGRASIAMIRALLGQPDFHLHSERYLHRQRRPRSSRPEKDVGTDDVRVQVVHAAVDHVEDKPPSNTDNVSATPDSSSFLPFSGLRDLLKSRTAPGDAEGTNVGQSITARMRVLGFNGTTQIEGRVEVVTGDKAVVIWDSGFKSFIETSRLTPLATASRAPSTSAEQVATP